MDISTGAFREVIRERGCYVGGDWSPDDRFLFTTWGYPDSPTELVNLPVDGGSPTDSSLDMNQAGTETGTVTLP